MADSHISSVAKIRLKTGVLLLIITPLGFLFKLYAGPFRVWLNDSVAGLLYEIFWILVIFFLVPKEKAAEKIAASVFVVTGFLEFLQLWHPVFLQQIRATFLGRTLIGTSFVWSDFIYYLIGCVTGWLLVKKISKEKRGNRTQ